MTFYKKEPIAGLFIFVDIFFLTHGVIPALNSVYSLMLLLIIVISLFYVYKANKDYGNSHFIKSLNLLIILFTIYGLLNIVSPIHENFYLIPNYRAHTYLTNAYKPMLQIYPLYYFCRKGYIDEDVITTWVIPSLIAVLIAYYVNSIELGVLEMFGEVQETNNTGYLIASLTSLLFFVNKRIPRYALLVIIIAGVFFCAKRGAIVITILCAIWFLFYDLRSAKATNIVWIIVLAVAASFLLFKFVSAIYEESYYLNYLLEKTESGNSSGRDVLFTKAWDVFINGSLLTILFGHGADSTFSLLGNRAHNDWLEFLVNQGLLGVFIYALFWIQIFRAWVRSKSHNYIVLGIIVILFFSRTLFSMLYNDLSPIACIPFAWCLASVDKEYCVVRRYKNIR